jgi:hypothetical protein
MLPVAPNESWGQSVINGYGASNTTPKKDGNVLFVNAATDLNKRVLSRAITGLVPGRYYKLVIPMRRIVANGTVEVSIDGVSSGSVAIANLPTTSWYDLPILLFTPDGTPRVVLVFRETSGQAGGADSAISNVELFAESGTETRHRSSHQILQRSVARCCRIRTTHKHTVSTRTIATRSTHRFANNAPAPLSLR